jgi:hypothetical protein
MSPIELRGLQAKIGTFSFNKWGDVICILQFPEFEVGNIYLSSLLEIMIGGISNKDTYPSIGWLECTDLSMEFVHDIKAEEVEIRFMSGDCIVFIRKASTYDLSFDVEIMKENLSRLMWK